MSKAENPPAFPSEFISVATQDRFVAINGMTLRDYFAGQALMGILANSEGESSGKEDIVTWYKEISEISYGYADAMLNHRQLNP